MIGNYTAIVAHMRELNEVVEYLKRAMDNHELEIVLMRLDDMEVELATVEASMLRLRRDIQNYQFQNKNS